MQRWQTLLITGSLCLAHSATAQAQTLFERLGQVLTQQVLTQEVPSSESTASEAAPVDETLPQIVLPESLPAPTPTPPSYTGRPTLGVTVEPLTDAIVRQRRLPVRSGAVITAIVQGSPAARAGLPLGGVIVALDGQRIDTPAHLVSAIRTAPTNRPVELSYYDGDRLYRKRVQILGPSVTQVTPTAPAPVRREPQPLRTGPSLEEQLGGRGQRPVLGRVGQLLDGLVAPAAGTAPVLERPLRSDETTLLREQVSLLQQEVAALRARLAAVETQLEKQGTAQ